MAAIIGGCNGLYVAPEKPSENQTEKILSGLHQIGQELSEMNLIYRR